MEIKPVAFSTLLFQIALSKASVRGSRCYVDPKFSS